VERRKLTRYHLRAPVVFSWPDSTGSDQQSCGFIHNISTAAAFIVSEQVPQLGSTVTMKLLLPPLEPSKTGISMTTNGIVVRVEQHGFAASVDLPRSFDDTIGQSK
jgi:hypothetical protein